MSTNSILPPNEIAQRAAAILVANAAGDKPRINALNRAAYQLATGAVSMVETFGGFLITSATRAGQVHRFDFVHGCGCEAGAAGRFCWHAAAIEICEEAGKYLRPAATMPNLLRAERPTRDEAFSINDELFN